MSEQKEATRGRILIVDDDANTLEILRRWLAREGYGTVSADNGPACLELLAKNPIDVILLDVMMPGIMTSSTITSTGPLASTSSAARPLSELTVV